MTKFRFIDLRPTVLAALFCLLEASTWAVCAQTRTGLWSGPTEPIEPGTRVLLTLHLLNPSKQVQARSFPDTIPCRSFTSMSPRPVPGRLKRSRPSHTELVPIDPQGFVQGQYQLAMPTQFLGQVIIEIMPPWPGRVILSVKKASPVAKSPKPAPKREEEDSPAELVLPSDPVAFFKEHFFPHEPMYFIAGGESPNAKFQISLKYRIFTGQGRLARCLPPVQDFYLAYSQTSLWDWDKPSAPFFDSSYKPEFLYSQEWVDRDQWASWFRMGFQAGLQHESNGRDKQFSRSLNILYVKPALTFGTTNGLQFTLIPRAWAYVGGLTDNRDLPDYRGYTDLRAILGWDQSIQLSVLGRLGEEFDRGSLQLDLTYPLWKVPLVRSSLFLHLQYFTGYGESLLEYNERSSVFRAGFALFR